MSKRPALPTKYHSFLLRVWCERRAGVVYWRSSLTPVSGGEPMGFPSLEAAMIYLHQQLHCADEDDVAEDRDPM